jgi:hypothetical protein
MLGLGMGTANAATQTYVLDHGNGPRSGISSSAFAQSGNTNASQSSYVEFLTKLTMKSFTPGGDILGKENFYSDYKRDLKLTVANIISIDPASWNIKTYGSNSDRFGFLNTLIKHVSSRRILNLALSMARLKDHIAKDYESTGGEDDEYFATEPGEFDSAVTGSSPVPVPAAVWLLGSALGGLAFMRRKQTSA